MKSLIALSFVFMIPWMASAQQITPKISCQNEFPSTTFQLEPEKGPGSDIILKVRHFFGVANAPIHSGVITSNDFAYLQKKAEAIKMLGDEVTIRFSPTGCETYGEGLWACANSNHQDINGVKVTSTGFSTRLIETKFYDETFKTHQLIFSFTYQGMVYDMPMNYDPTECSMK